MLGILRKWIMWKIDYLVNVREIPEERAKNAINAIAIEFAEDVFAHIVIIENEKIISRGVAGKISDSIVNFYFTDFNDKNDIELFAKIIQVLKKRKVNLLQTFLNETFQKSEDRYLKLGFVKQSEIKLYEKELL